LVRDAGTEQDRQGFPGQGAEFGRVVRAGHGVQVADEVQVLLGGLPSPPPHGTQVVAELDVSGRGDAGEAGHDWLLGLEWVAARSSPAPDMTKAAQSGGLEFAWLRCAQRIRAAGKRPTTGCVEDVAQACASL